MKDLTGFCIPNLEWKFDAFSENLFTADTEFGQYCIRKRLVTEHKPFEAVFKPKEKTELRVISGIDHEKAKSACQEHYENQILSMLSGKDWPQPKTEEFYARLCVSIVRDLSDEQRESLNRWLIPDHSSSVNK